MNSTRTQTLSQIIEIDNKISRISKSARYRKVQNYIRLLSGNIGSSLVMVEDPMNMGEVIPVRRNSIQGKAYLESYESILSEYEDNFNKLNKLKKSYTEALF